MPGTQGASIYGHVAVVESINADGTVHTSNMNWGYQAQPTLRTLILVSDLMSISSGTSNHTPYMLSICAKTFFSGTIVLDSGMHT
jgi:surface antigen